MKKCFILLFSLALVGLSLNAQTVTIDSVKSSGISSMGYVFVTVNVPQFGLPANVFVEYGRCPYYNTIGTTMIKNITVAGTSSYIFIINNLKQDSCYMMQAIIGGGVSSAFSSIYTFINTLVHPCSFTPGIISTTDSICSGSTSLLVATPAGAKYQWKKNGNILTADTLQTLNINSGGTYRVLITKNSCTDSIEKLISMLPSPIIMSYAISSGVLIINGHFQYPVITEVGGVVCTPAYSDSLQIIINGIIGVHTGDVIHVGYTNGCSADTVMMFTGIGEINPVSGREKDFRIFNLQGQEVKKPLSPGFYIQGRKRFIVGVNNR